MSGDDRQQAAMFSECRRTNRFGRSGAWWMRCWPSCRRGSNRGSCP